MKKKLFFVLFVILSAFLFVACNNEQIVDLEFSDSTISNQEENSDSDSSFDNAVAFDPTPYLSPDDGEHVWSLLSFVAEESEIPCAGMFVCKECSTQRIRPIVCDDIEIPIVFVSGDLSGISKTDKAKVQLFFSRKDLQFSVNATMKWQGDGSLAYPKKNYSITLYDTAFDKKKKVTMKEEWGSQSKYCLKANYSDPTGARNLVLSDLYGMAARSVDYTDEYSKLLNGGAVDGFPVLLYTNGRYAGLYNWNIPKDKWLFKMGDDAAGEAALCGDALLLDEASGITIDEETKGHWEIEYCNEKFAEENGTDWAVRSFNEMLAFVQSSDKETLKTHSSEYLNVERTLDVILFSCVLGGSDTIVKNMLWTTYDGKRWAPNLYDLDRTFGRDGRELESPVGFEDFKGQPLYGNIFMAFFDELKARYFELRRTILNTETVMSLFSVEMAGLDDRYFLSEMGKWPDAIWRETMDEVPIFSFADELKYIESYTDRRLAYCDQIFEREELIINEFGYLDWGEEK